jgi:uncharacterized protein YgbK (DUF1537 family)
MSGSCSPVTSGQIDWAVSNGFADVPLRASALARGEDIESNARLIAAHVRAGRHVIAYSSRGSSAPELANGSASLGRALGEITRGVLAQSSVRRVVVAGGDSSSHAARALGIEAVEMIAPLTPGAPLCRAHAPGSPIDGREVNFKGGQVGAPDYFGAVVAGQLKSS